MRNLSLLGGVLFGTIAVAAAEFNPDAMRKEIRQALAVPQPLPALDVRSHGTFQAEPGVVAERVAYTTGYGMRVPAIVYRPTEQRTGRPGVVVVNGHGGDKYSWYAFYAGMLYARAGAVVVTYDPIGEGERNAGRASGTRAHDAVQSPPELAQRLGGLMITDAMQAVSFLEAQRDVDPKRIAMVGYSMGSFVTALTGAVDPRIRACIVAGGGNLDGPGEYWDTSKPMCQGLPYQALSFLGDRGAAIYALHAVRGPTLVCNGLEDEIVRHDPRGPQELFRDLQTRVAALQPAGIFETRFEAGAGHRPWFVTKPAAEWLHRQLQFPAWNETPLAHMAVTHVSEWAQTQKVEVDRAYATEIREGGTRALGTGIPGLSRQQLTVFDDATWRAEATRLTYEAWLAAARRQLTGMGLPAYDIARASGPIAVDGRLDEDAWARAKPAGPFHARGGGTLREATEVKLLWDDTNLYVAYRCQDAQIAARILERHGPVSTDDCVELFVSPNPSKVKNYYTFEINAVGAMLNRCRTDWWRGPPTWEPEGIRTATSLPAGAVKIASASDREWIVELAVPLRNFARDAAHMPPRHGDIWRLNLNRTAGPGGTESSTWSPLPTQVKSFHTPSAFGMVRFVSSPAP